MNAFKGIALALAATLVLACEPELPPVAPMAPPPAETAAPPPADPPPVTEGDVTRAVVNGVTILVKRVPGAEITSASLYVKGGVRDWTAANAGIEELAVATAASGGTDKLGKDAFAEKLAALGTDLGANSGPDHADFWSKGLTREFDATFDLLLDTFLSPAMPPAEIELQRQRMLSHLRHEQESPDDKLGLLVHMSLFKGHPYENRAVGTMQSVAALTREQLVAHLAKLRETSRLLVVVVGDIDPAHVADSVRRRLGAVPRGTYQDTALPPIAFASSRVDVTSSPLPTNYIEGVFVGPKWSDPDFVPAMIAMGYLQYKLFEEVRTKRNLSYAPHAGFRWSGPIPLGTLYVTAVDPNTTIQVMYAEAKKLKDTPISSGDLAAAKATFATSHLMSSETTDGQAGWLAEAELIGGDWHLEKTLPARVNAVTAAQVQDYAKKYMMHLQTTVVGDPAKIDKTLFGSM